MYIDLYDSSLQEEFAAYPPKIRARIFKTIDLLEIFGNRLGMPHSKALGTGLFELRIHGEQAIRILYCYHKDRAILLHCCTKKSQKTPMKDIGIAKERMQVLHKIYHI